MDGQFGQVSFALAMSMYGRGRGKRLVEPTGETVQLLMGWQVMQWLMAEMAVTVCQTPHCGGQVGEQRW
jgi:hypothetical protein